MAFKITALPTALIPPPERYRIDPLAPPPGVAVFTPWATRVRKLQDDRRAREDAIKSDPDRALILGTIHALDATLEEAGIFGFGQAALREAQTIAPALDLRLNVLCADAAWALYQARGGHRPTLKAKGKQKGKGRRS